MNTEPEISVTIISHKTIHLDGYETPVRHGPVGFILGVLDYMHHDQVPIQMLIQFFFGFLKESNTKEDWFFLLVFLFISALCGALFLFSVFLITVGTMVLNPIMFMLGLFAVFVVHFLFNEMLLDPQELMWPCVRNEG